MMSRSVRRRALTVAVFAEVLTVLCLNQRVVSADDCDAILEQGIRNTYQSLDKTDLRTSTKNAVCASSSSSSGGGSGGGIGLSIPIEGVPIGFNGNYDQNSYNNIKNSSCGTSSAQMSDSQFHSVLSMIADQQVVNAWSQCKAKSGGLYMNARANGNIVVFEVRFRPIGTVSSAKVNSDPQFFGVTCGPSIVIKNGTVITNATLLQACVRQGSGEVTAIVNTDWDGASIFIPAVNKITATPSTTPSPFPGAQRSRVVYECRVNRAEVPQLPPSAPLPNCPFFGGSGQQCGCPEFDGRGGVSRMMRGVSLPPSDAFWNFVSSSVPGVERGR